jgi:hypothetical protein
LKKLAAAALGACAFVFAGVALSAASYSDTVDDANAAPDLTSVTVAEPVAGSLQITVSVGNFQSLPTNSWVNIWFDLDSDPMTGESGDEALVRYLSDGALELYVWNGAQLVESPTAGTTASFSAGTLTLSVPKGVLGASAAFGILAVSARGQEFGDEELIASDYAPDSGRSAFVGPALAAFADAANDHDAAPDIASIRVSDAKNGWVSFAITTPNYTTLPSESIVSVSIDADNRRSTGDGGAEVRITSVGGEFELERWVPATKIWAPDGALTRVRMRNAGGVVTVDVHRSELGGSNRLGFSVVTADINTSADAVVGIDVAPDEAPFFTYTFTNKAALTLEATRLSTSPARPRAGKPFAVNLAVRRSDTGKGITSGTVACRVLLKERSVPARGSVAGGSGRCVFVVPASAKGKLVRGSITVRAGGKSVAADFKYLVR